MALVDRLGFVVDATEAPSSSTPNAGLAIKTAVRAATTGANIALSGLQTIDGVALAAGDRVLVKDQTNQTTNGIYNVSTGNWAAASDFQNNGQIAQGIVVLVSAGTVNANVLFELTTPNPITLGTSNIVWAVLNLVRGAGLSFTRVSLTSSTTLSNGAKGQTIALGGTPAGLPFVLTVGATSGYDPNYCALIFNESTTRGWALAINGITSFILWPLQTVILFNDNGTWQIAPRTQRWRKSSPVFQVDNVNGSDSALNDGQGAQGTAGAFLTIQNAWTVIQQVADPAGTTCLIDLPAVTATPIVENISVTGAMPQGVSEITVNGNAVTPTSCQWQVGSNLQGAGVSDYQSMTFVGIGWSGSGTGATFVGTRQWAIVDFYNCDFGNNPAGLAAGAGENSKINIVTNNSMSGTSTYAAFVQASDNSTIFLAFVTLTINGTPTVTRLAQATGGALVVVTGLSFAGAGTISGQRFFATGGGQIVGDSGVSWPAGLTAGSATLGGTADAANTTFGALGVTGALASSPTLGLGYATGAGGTVTQLTNKSTGVTLNTVCGAITMNNAQLNAGALVAFTLTDSAIAATDTVIVNHLSGGSFGNYAIQAAGGAGGAQIAVRNVTAGNLSDAIVIQFAVIKGADS